MKLLKRSRAATIEPGPCWAHWALGHGPIGPIHLLGPIWPGPYWAHLGDSFEEVIGLSHF